MLTREFGKYRLTRRLGRGGMADVYLARDTESDLDVALKLLEIRPDRDSQEIYDAERRGAVLQEAFSRVDTHVPAVHAYGTLEGHFYLDMEYVEGEDLTERLAPGPLPPAEAVRIALEVCAFLERAHAFEAVVDGLRVRGIIHGDLKPKNVRIGPDGAVKVLDFGIAKGLSLTRKLTRNDFGSPAYLSPERLDSGAVDIQSDCWAVGVLLYELLSGDLPFRGETNSQLEHQIMARVVPAPLPVACPTGLVRIVHKVLHGDLDRRYPGAAAIGTDLRAWSEGLGTQADREWEAGWLAPRVAIRGANGSPAGQADEDGLTRRTHALVSAPESVSGADGVDGTADGGADVGVAVRQDVITDAEATRRTTEPGVADDAPGADGDIDVLADLPLSEALDAPAGIASTTAPPASAGTAAAPAGGTGIARPATRIPGRSPRMRRIGNTVAAVIGVTVLAAAGNEARVWGEARGLRVDIATRPPTDTAALWTRFEALSRQSLLGLGVVGVRGPLRDRLSAQAERVIGNYRHNAPAVRESNWIEAGSWLTSALTLDPSDRGLAARLRYCEGHLQRIEAEARKRKKLPATDPLNEAVARFEEAARLDRGWPDPYLGLARVYIYGLEDLDKAIAALDEAERRGYRGGAREIAQLADGYRARADRHIKDADALDGLPQQLESLNRAASDLRQAIDLYQKAAGFGDAGTSLRAARRRLDEVEARIQKADPPNLLERILREVAKRDIEQD